MPRKIEVLNDREKLKKVILSIPLAERDIHKIAEVIGCAVENLRQRIKQFGLFDELDIVCLDIATLDIPFRRLDDYIKDKYPSISVASYMDRVMLNNYKVDRIAVNLIYPVGHLAITSGKPDLDLVRRAYYNKNVIVYFLEDSRVDTKLLHKFYTVTKYIDTYFTTVNPKAELLTYKGYSNGGSYYYGDIEIFNYKVAKNTDEELEISVAHLSTMSISLNTFIKTLEYYTINKNKVTLLIHKTDIKSMKYAFELGFNLVDIDTFGNYIFVKEN